MKKNVVFVFILISTITLSAQSLEFSGYFENQLFPQSIKGVIKITDYNKLRLDLNSKISEQVSFSADYIYKTINDRDNSAKRMP